MSRIYKKYGSKLKAKIAIDAIGEQKTLGELSKEYGMAPYANGNMKKIS